MKLKAYFLLFILVTSTISCGDGSKFSPDPKSNSAPPPVSIGQDSLLEPFTKKIEGSRASYEIKRLANHVQLKNTKTNEFTSVYGATTLVFDDMKVKLDISDLANSLPPNDLDKIIELYVAFFNRTPDAEGLAYWASQRKAGVSIQQIAESFLSAAVLFADETGYSSNMTDSDFIKTIYKNVLGRTGTTAPSDDEIKYWTDEIRLRGTRTTVVINMLHSARTFENDPSFGWVTQLLNNKILVSRYVAIEQGITHLSPEVSIIRGKSIIEKVTPSDISIAKQASGLIDTSFNLTQVISANDTEAQSVHDKFNGQTMNTCKWFDWSTLGTRSFQNEGLYFKTSSTEKLSLHRVISQYSLRGDFAYEVDLSVDAAFEQPIPDGAQKYATLGLYLDGSNFFFLSIAREANRTVIKPLINRNANFSNPPVFGIASGTATLRIEHRNNQITASAGHDGKWSEIGKFSSFGNEDYYVYLGATTIGVAHQFNAKFTNFRLIYGSSSFRAYQRTDLKPRTDFSAGSVTEGYAYDKWFNRNQPWGQANPFEIMQRNGMNSLRTTITTNSVATLRNTPSEKWLDLEWNGNYWQSQEVGLEILKISTKLGFQNTLVFFLSDTHANASLQNAPRDWKDLTVDATAQKLEEYTRNTTTLFKKNSVDLSYIEIGNEIDTGILNFRPGDRIAAAADGSLDNLDYMKTKVWPTEAALLKAAIRGAKSAAPEAKIVLHVANTGTTPSDMFVKAFFKFMTDQGVPFDVAGLTIPYPFDAWRLHEYSSDCWFQRLQETSDYLARLGKKVVFSEGSYPNSSAGIKAQAMSEFPYTEQGQASWVKEMLRFSNNHPNISGFMYFYADWYPGRAAGDAGTLGLESIGLFRANKTPTPAMLEYTKLK